MIDVVQVCLPSKSTELLPGGPLQARGISLIPSMCKMYSYVLNKRLSKWTEDNSVVKDCQNGFRQKRSTIDHLTTLTTVIESRKTERKPTFVAFND